MQFLALGGASGKETTCQCRRHKRREFHPWVGKISWRRERKPTPVFLPGESHGQKSLASYSPWDHTELDTTEVTKQQRPHINAFFLNLFQYGLSQEIGYSSLYCTVKVKVAQSCQTLYDPKDYIQSMEFSRPEYWSGLSFPSQGIFPSQGSNLHLVCSLPLAPPGKPFIQINFI